MLRDGGGKLVETGHRVGVAEATRDFPVSKPAISAHLKVLEESGVVVRVIDGRNHRLSLDPHALDEAAEWMDV